MMITYDTKTDALYILFRKGRFARNKEVEDGIILDLDRSGRLLGIEILEASQRIPLSDLTTMSIKLPLDVGQKTSTAT